MELSIVRAILNYQFGDKVGDKIVEKYENSIKVEVSKNTGRIRRVYIDDKLFGTIEPTTGFLIPSFFGGEIIKGFLEYPKYRVVVSDDSLPFIKEGKSVFCKFVVEIDDNILPEDIVFVVDSKDNLIAVGIAKLSASEIKSFNRGVAVKIKHVGANI